MGWLDGVNLSQSPTLFGLLNMPADSGPLDVLTGASRGEFPGAEDELAKRFAESPFQKLDREKQKEQPKTVFDTGAAAVPAAGISGQQAVNVDRLGQLTPMTPADTGIAPPMPPAKEITNTPIAAPLAPPPAAAASAADPAALPPNATPTEGKGTPATADVPETSLLGRIGRGLSDNSNLLLSLASGFAGAPSFGTGMSRAFQAAVPGSQLDVKQQNINLTADALMKRGLPRDAAMAAATNPSIMQQILPQAFGVKQRKFTQIGEDMMGNKQFGFVDEANGKTYDMAGKEIGQGATTGAGGNIPVGPDGEPLQGQALLSHLEQNDPVTAAGVKGLISGDLNAQGRNLQKLAPLAKLVDPTFDAKDYPTRLKVRQSYTSGKDFQELQALNTVGGHLGKLMDSADRLGNTSVPLFNKAKNLFADTFTGSPELVKFRNDLVTTANELAKAYHGGHVSDSAYAAFNKAINEAQTPAEMKAAIGELAGLLDSKIAAKESGYRDSMGPAPIPSQYSALNDEAKHSFARIGQWANGGAMTSGAGAPVRVNSPADAAKLPRGTRFVDPNGIERVVP